MLARARKRWADLDPRSRREILILVALLFAFGFFQQRPAWNEFSRYDLVRAIVDERTIRIDSFHQNTGDKAFYEGHWYSDKAPGTAILGVPVYAILSLASQVTGGGPPSEVEAVQALAFVESGIATAILVLLLIRFLTPFVGERWAVGVGLAYAFGSIALPFATMFFGHAASTATAFGAFWLLYRQKVEPVRWKGLAAGFLAGWAVLIEVPVVLAVAALFAYALSIGRSTALRFVVGGLPLAAVFGAYNWLAFGSPLSLGYQHATVFAEQNAQGLVSIVWPSLDRAGDLLFSERGLLRLAPWFALAPLGLVALKRRDLRNEVLLAATICALFLTYNSGALNPFGGWTPGPRYLLPALPFAAILVALIPAGLRTFAAALMIVSAAIFLVATATMPNAPERYRDPLFDLWIPMLQSGAFADTAAWLRWGIPGIGAFTVLLLGLGFGLLALALSYGTRFASRSLGRVPIALAVLALAFSFPFPPPAPFGLPNAGTDAPPSIAVIDMGNTRLVSDGKEELRLWATIENRGGSIASSQLQFSAARDSGESVWGAYYGDVRVDGGSRQTITMTWRPDGPGTYRYSFSVKDGESGAVYASVFDADLAVVQP